MHRGRIFGKRKVPSDVEKTNERIISQLPQD